MRLVKEDGPVCVYYELHLRVLHFSSDWLTIHLHKNCRPVANKDRRWIVAHGNGRSCLRLINARYQPIEGDHHRRIWWQECSHQLIHLVGSGRVKRRKMSIRNDRVAKQHSSSVNVHVCLAMNVHETDGLLA